MVKVKLAGKELSNIISYEITLGQQEMASTIKLEISDVLGILANDIIKHTTKTGGIQPLRSEQVLQNSTQLINNQTPISSTSISAENGVVARGEKFTPEVLAFLDVIARHEVGGYYDFKFSEDWYYTQLGGALFTRAEAAKGYPYSTGTKAAGRYQFHRRDWDHFQKVYPNRVRDFTPQSQDIIALWKLEYRGALKPLLAGDIRTAISKAGKEWASLPGSPYGQVPEGWTESAAIAYYEQRRSYYRGSKTNQVQTKKTPVPTTPAFFEKGSLIEVELQGYFFEFYHQSTNHRQDGKTVIQGQSVRWVLSRRKRNKTEKNITLKQLAQKVADANKVKLAYKADINPVYDHIDQSNISDYTLLKREAEQAGLYISDENGVITIKSGGNAKDTSYYVQSGVNLISYNISDRAIDLNNEAPLLQSENKSDIDPISGKILDVRTDLDSVVDQSNTGRNARNVSGRLKPGQAEVESNRIRYKRVKGLPSSFVVSTSVITGGVNPLSLKPLDAIRSKDLGETLSRIWMVEKVTHKSDGSTTLEVTSPIETLARVAVAPTLPRVDTSPGLNTSTPINVPTGVWVNPITGSVTSPYGWRRGRMHRGVDIAGAYRTPIVAAMNGVVTRTLNNCRLGNASCGLGFGNYVYIKHPNGYTSVYAHLFTGSVTVRTGQTVKAGQIIGSQGNTGASRGDHLHFEIRQGSERLDPDNFLSSIRSTGAKVTAGRAAN